MQVLIVLIIVHKHSGQCNTQPVHAILFSMHLTSA